MDTVAVIIASYGDREVWTPLVDRAMSSVDRQTRLPDYVVRFHGECLSQARNFAAAEMVPSSIDWLCFLDADDELEQEYLEHMMDLGGRMELRYPRVQYISPQWGPQPPKAIPVRPLNYGNFMVIGTLIPRKIFISAGGFRDLRAYEDWDLWIRAWMLGCNPRLIDKAIYGAHMREGSRNSINDPSTLCSEIIAYNKRWQECLKSNL